MIGRFDYSGLKSVLNGAWKGAALFAAIRLRKDFFLLRELAAVPIDTKTHHHFLVVESLR